jgi:hypothetical protein
MKEGEKTMTKKKSLMFSKLQIKGGLMKMAKVKMSVLAGSVMCLLSQMALAQTEAWKVAYDDKGGVTITSGEKQIFKDADGISLISTVPNWHGIYAWMNEGWGKTLAAPKKTEELADGKKKTVYKDEKPEMITVTKEITEMGPKEVLIKIKALTPAGGPGNVFCYNVSLPQKTYTGSTLNTDGIGYPLDTVNPLKPDWMKSTVGRLTDHLRYNLGNAEFAVPGTGKIKFVLTEEPISPEKARGWTIGAGVNSDGTPMDYGVGNTYSFDSKAKLERTLTIKITGE